MDDVALAWFRRDLRLADNPAWAAATAHQTVAPIVVLEPQLLRAAGPHRLQAYFGAVAGLERALNAVGATLHIAIGNPCEVLPLVAAELGVSTVTANADVTPYAVSRDQRVASTLRHQTQTHIEMHWGTLVHPPGSVLTGKGTLSQVFTPFWKRWQTLKLPPKAQAVPGSTGWAGRTATSLAEARSELERLGVSVPPVDSAPANAPDNTSAGAASTAAPATAAAPSEQCAAARLEAWLAQVDRYHETRNEYDIEGTSELASALHFGSMSPRSLVETVGTHTTGREAFVRQIAWRDWYAHLVYEHPNMAHRALRPDYDRIAWRSGIDADGDWDAWIAGRTGYPIVDAAMRQLSATGWIHNRLRMIVASFLVKDLLIDWRRGERWFRHMLTDGDVAQNVGNWQWVAGTGPDAAPYFRVFNPVTQSRRYDPDGNYLRRWLPELAQLPNRTIHAPWEAAPHVLATAGVRLDVDYPAPIVDHAEARQRTLAAYQAALSTSASGNSQP